MATRAEFLKEACKSLPEGDIVECGVLRGDTAKVLVEGRTDKRKVWLFDSFEGFPKLGPEDVFPRKLMIAEKFHKATIEQVKKNLPSLENVEFVKGLFEETAPAHKDIIKKIALLHFDGDLYSGLVAVLKNFLPNVVKGGIVVVHDYPGFPGIKKAVDEIIGEKNIKIINPYTICIQR